VVFVWLLEILAQYGFVVRPDGRDCRDDAGANAALRSIVRRDTADQYEAFLPRFPEESGIETPTRARPLKLHRKCAKKGPNQDWTLPDYPDTRTAKMKDGKTHLVQASGQLEVVGAREC
jgi:transposase